jgi:hypothetical protein
MIALFRMAGKKRTRSDWQNIGHNHSLLLEILLCYRCNEQMRVPFKESVD